MNIIQEFDKLKKPSCTKEREKFKEFRKRLKLHENILDKYGDYISLTLDGQAPESAAKELNLF